MQQMETNAAFLNLIVRAYADDRDAFDALEGIRQRGSDVNGLATNLDAIYANGVVNSLVTLYNNAQAQAPVPIFPSGIDSNGKIWRENEVTLADVNYFFQKIREWGSGFNFRNA
jgi:hypothetical protein